MHPNLKYAFNTALLLFVAGSLVYTFLPEKPSENTGTATPRPLGLTVQAVEGVDPEWAVYFFYNDVYCDTCEKLEGYALGAVRAHFGDELNAGIIQWRSIDMTTPENAHYAVDYSLYSKSIVLVELDNGEVVRWKNLEEIWDLVYDQQKYVHYIRDSMKDFMDGTP